MTPARSGRRDIMRLVKVARAQGWTVEITGGGHLRWKPPEGEFVVSSSSPSDGRAFNNVKADLRRRGLDC